MARLRICYLTALYPAISHTFILREVESLRARGVDLRTVSVRRPEASHLRGLAEAEAARTTFFILPEARRPLTLPRALGGALVQPRRLLRTLMMAWRTAPPGLSGAAYQAVYLAEALVLARHLRAEAITHLHGHFAQQSANVAMLAAELAGIPFSLTLHGPADLYEPGRWHLREKIRRAAFVACISHFARAQAMNFSDPADWGKLHIIHCGVVPELYEAAGTPAPSRPGRLRMVFVGRLSPVKGLRVLIAALADPRLSGLELTLDIIGDGEDRRHLEAAAAPLGDRVRFLGYRSQDEVADLLAGSDALVLPSFAEGLPVVLMEALAAGKPVIATRVAGVAELVEDGVSGLLVHAGDAGGLAAAIARLAGDPEARHRMGQAGRDKVSAEFDVRHEAERLAALFAAGPAPDGATAR